MEDTIKALLLFSLLLGACSPYFKVEKLYNDGRFAEAYGLLLEQNPAPLKYKEYEFKLALLLVMGGDNNYLPLLSSLMDRPAPKGAEEAHAVSAAWDIYLHVQNPKDFQEILNALPREPLHDIHLEKARIALLNQALFNLERYPEVVHNLKGKTGKNSELIYLLGASYQSLRDFAPALALYKEVMRLSESPVLKGLTSFRMGEIYESNQDDSAAQAAYLESWSYAASNASLNFKLGRLLAKNGNDSLSQRFYRAALRLDENHAEAWYYLNLQ